MNSQVSEHRSVHRRHLPNRKWFGQTRLYLGRHSYFRILKGESIIQRFYKVLADLNSRLRTPPIYFTYVACVFPSSQ